MNSSLPKRKKANSSVVVYVKNQKICLMLTLLGR